jgi:hypothetical protein
VKDSFNISISFKTNLSQLNQLEQTCRNNGMSRSEIIRAGIILMIQKLGATTSPSNTSNTDNLDVYSLNPDTPPSVDMFGTSSSSVTATTSTDDLYPAGASLYGWK